MCTWPSGSTTPLRATVGQRTRPPPLPPLPRGSRGKGLSPGARRGWRGPGLGKALPSQPGRLKKVQAIGWYLDEKNLAQVSTNLLDFEVTALHTVYEETCREAQVGRVAPLPPSWGSSSPARGLTLLGPCRS